MLNDDFICLHFYSNISPFKENISNAHETLSRVTLI